MHVKADFKVKDMHLEADFSGTSKAMGAKFGQLQRVTEYVGGEAYNGEYTVTPRVEAQTLPTKEKVMLEDVTIRAIPYAEVTNNSNGKTVTIG